MNAATRVIRCHPNLRGENVAIKLMYRLAVCAITCLAVVSAASAQQIAPIPVPPGMTGTPPAAPPTPATPPDSAPAEVPLPAAANPPVTPPPPSTILSVPLPPVALNPPAVPSEPLPTPVAPPTVIPPVAIPPVAANPTAIAAPRSLPPVMPVAPLPAGAAPMTYSAPPPAPNFVSPPGTGMGFLPTAPASPSGVFPAQAQPMPTRSSVPGQTPAQDPLLSSRPPPFQASPDSTTGGTFDGLKQVHNAFDEVLSGKFRNTRYKWYGFVRLDGIFDYKPMGTTDAFVTSSIPVPQGRGQNSVLTPRYTRLGLDTETPLRDLDWTMKTRIEMDFFNGFSSGAVGSFSPRLRFAWADFGPFLIGQAASLFMDYDVFPSVLDYEGPGGMVLMRQPLIAVHFPVGEKVKVSVGVEQPYSDIQWFENGAWVVNPGNGIITRPGVGRNIQDVPDLTGNVRYTGDYGHAQVAGIVRKLTFQPGTGDAFNATGYGINATGTLHPWAMISGTPKSGDCATIWSRSRFMGQFAAGRGISRYIQDTGGLGLDATYDPVNGFRTVPGYGWFAAYEQWWAKKWASVFTYGEDSFDLPDTLPGNTYQKANYLSANIIWLPVDRMGVGLEVLHGFRQNKDGQRGDNTRIQLGFQYRF